MNTAKFNGYFAIFSALVVGLLYCCKADGLHPNPWAALLILLVVYIYARCRFAIADYKRTKR